ncbi:uncharacterized protein F4812DRAFT_152569 [Daldinia caldariorum]|uniref:uncharacterized protein n=1 Tax=Daldinia caldariorum TaxID=326644 RepID=UPI002007BE56|nr:uncharacterized protein F4812DRAFT_152569 [Daldinia caldariorum]KAI1464739.1 hypothetical protein F4812DRAFT_152569 [Daldinia caldariorum]
MASSPQQPTPHRPSASNANAHPRPVTPYDREMPTANELMEIGSRSLQVGVIAGGAGLVIGAGSGILRSAPPALFAIVASLQWFALGSTYTASKHLLWHAWGGRENLTTSDVVKSNGVAGGVAGMIGGMFRGPKNILPGMLVFGTLGAAGGYAAELFRGRSKGDSKAKSSWLDSKWSPMKRLTDKEYEEMLEEKILRINAEISIIDDNIASLRASNGASTKSDEGKKSK